MKIEIVKISELNPAVYNPRRISEKKYQDLLASLKKFKIVEPAVVNNHPGRENIIIGGHQRIRAATELGMKEFPCHYVNLIEKDEKELNVRLNKNTGEFDFDILANEFEVGDLMEWGFTDKDLGLFDDAEAPTGKGSDLKSEFKIEIECNSEEDQQMTFEKLTKMGYECKVSTF